MVYGLTLTKLQPAMGYQTVPLKLTVFCSVQSRSPHVYRLCNYSGRNSRNLFGRSLDLCLRGFPHHLAIAECVLREGWRDVLSALYNSKCWHYSALPSSRLSACVNSLVWMTEYISKSVSFEGFQMLM